MLCCLKFYYNYGQNKKSVNRVQATENCSVEKTYAAIKH